MTAPLDPRLHPHRPDLAAAWLEGRVEAARFVEGETAQLRAPSLGVRAAPRFDAPYLTEALMGETVRVFEEREGWAWCQLVEDGYVGYLPSGDLGREIVPPTHRVAVPLTFLYPAPDIKTQPAVPVGLHAGLAIKEQAGAFFALADGLFVYGKHIRPLAEHDSDFVAVAESLMRAPYLWGGKTWAGLDCSGLIQLSLQAAGKACPRDTDMQETMLGHPIDAHGFEALRRGDIVFWRGHVGIMADSETIVHANAFHMQVTLEPLFEVVERIAAHGNEVTSIRRL